MPSTEAGPCWCGQIVSLRFLLAVTEQHAYISHWPFCSYDPHPMLLCYLLPAKALFYKLHRTRMANFPAVCDITLPPAASYSGSASSLWNLYLALFIGGIYIWPVIIWDANTSANMPVENTQDFMPRAVRAYALII